MAVGAFGEFVFSVSDKDGAQCVTFDALTQATSSRLATHATVEGLPVVEFLGVDADRITLSGRLNEQMCADVDDKILELRGLQDGTPRPLTRGSRVFGMYLVAAVDVTEERWRGDGILTQATYRLQLIATRVTANG